MLDEPTRLAVLRLREQGHGTRTIARALGISRGAVRTVLSAGTATVPEVLRSSRAEDHRERIAALFQDCRGNLVRVHEELASDGVDLSYAALTAFCRRAEIGRPPRQPSGQYHFEPGQEMQHDTSPHVAKIGGADQHVQTASLVLCYSRMIFFQCYPRFTRFHCKLFLTDALQYMGGSCAACMIDNTHVVVLSGTGKDMVPVPEMAGFAQRFRFDFVAHERGDANRSARVERPFDFIENNFLAGRSFADMADLDAQAVAFCDRVNGTRKRHLHAAPRDLFATERTCLRPLPLHIPEVYQLHHRLVDTEGYVTLHRHHYSAPPALIGRRLEVRETKDRIDFFVGPRCVASHRPQVQAPPGRVLLPEHRVPRGEHAGRRREEEDALRGSPELLRVYVAAMRQRLPPLRATLTLRRLLALRRDYPEEPFLSAVRTATVYGLFDMDRLERLILRTIGSEYFVLPSPEDPDDGEEEE
jgi:predicted transcriptional regulator